MANEKKQLLLKDLSVRLSHRVMVETKPLFIPTQPKYDKSVLPFFMVKAMIDNGVKVRYFTFE